MSIDSIRNYLVAKGKQLFDEGRSTVTFSGDIEADKLLNNIEEYPHAFVIACIMDRQIKAERAWVIPYRISQKLNGFDFSKLAVLPIEQIKQLMTIPEPLHRFSEQMSNNLFSSIQIIKNEYAGLASRIWNYEPPSAEVVYRFLQFPGVGPKIASMATNMLVRHFKVPLSDHYSIDISPDTHVRRVFFRLGLVTQNITPEKLIYRARSLHPEFPGLMDLSTWEIGRNWCHPISPFCSECYMASLCPTAKKS